MTEQPRLTRLVRYPVKGMPGQELPSARVPAGGGLPYDRAVAVTSGRRPVPERGLWAPTKTFLTLRSRPGLQRWTVEVHEADEADEDAGTLTLTHPAHGTLTVPLGERGPVEPEGGTAAGAFADGTTLVRAAGGYWDDPDGAVSLVNLATVDALARATSAPVDPLRFRANLYLAGMPAWAELGLVGERIAVGPVELEILHPINRCPATSVNPADGRRDLEVPAQLAAHFGHIYCGLRARVVTGGTLTPGDRLVRTGRRTRPAVADSGPGPARWPRPARVTARTPAGPDAFFLELDDPLAEVRPAPLPGQHLRVHTSDGGSPVWGTYPLAGYDDSRLRISVERAGRLPELLYETTGGDGTLLISGPHRGA